jgi:hypothetical protein
MRGPSQATSAKDAGLQAEVAAILLHQNIGGDFGGPE